MKAFHTYLNFDGNTREAMSFYQKCLDAKLQMRSFRDAKVDAPKGAEDRIIHARLEKGSGVLMASDTMPGTPFRPLLRAQPSSRASSSSSAAFFSLPAAAGIP